MANQELINNIVTSFKNNIETSFKTHFPMGEIEINSYNDDRVNIKFYFGMIGDIADIDSQVRGNDPMCHGFAIRQENDNLVTEMMFGGLNCKSSNPLYEMDTIKTKFRKTTGDINKICTTYDKLFKTLKDLVVAQGNNIYKAEMYQKYI